MMDADAVSQYVRALPSEAWAIDFVAPVAKGKPVVDVRLSNEFEPHGERHNFGSLTVRINLATGDAESCAFIPPVDSKLRAYAERVYGNSGGRLPKEEFKDPGLCAVAREVLRAMNAPGRSPLADLSA